MTTDRRADALAKAKIVESRLGRTTKGAAKRTRPETEIKPKGTNPLKGRYGAEITFKW